MTQWIFSLFFVLLSGTVFASDLKVTVGPNPTAVLPIDLLTCQDEVQQVSKPALVSKPSIDFGTFRFQWLGQKDYKMSYMELTMKDSRLEGENYSCVIGGSELQSIISPKQNGIQAGDHTVYQAQCGIRCGSIPFKHTAIPAVFNASLKIYGVEYDQMGNGTSVVTEVPLLMEKKF